MSGWKPVGLAWLGLALFGCAGQKPAKTAATTDTLTTRQRQEAIGRSGLPGAKAINKALEAADSEAARVGRLDSIR
jgi:hypothetical protein